MDEILTAIKTALQSAIAAVPDGDIIVVPSIDYIPNGTSLPCITIKDGGITNRALMGGCVEQEMVVYVSPWVEMVNDETSLTGATSVVGLLDLIDDIESALNNNLLDITGLQSAWCESSAPSELFGDDREALQRKTITVTYEKEG